MSTKIALFWGFRAVKIELYIHIAMFTRTYEKALSDLLSPPLPSNDVLLVEGARQVGKTTLIRKVLSDIKDSHQISILPERNLEVDRTFRAAIDRTNSFLELEELFRLELGFQPHSKQIIFIDEAQESLLLGGYVREMKERWPQTRVILSGSSMSRLFGPEVRVPVGRVQRFKVTPFLFQEYLAAKEEQYLLELLDSFDGKAPLSAAVHERALSNYDEYLAIGGLPEVLSFAQEGKDYRKKRRDILLYQQEDFQRKVGTFASITFESALGAIATHVGMPAKFSHLGHSVGQIRRIIAALREWYLIYEVPTRGIASTTQFHPKRYLYDLGILQDVRAMPFPALSILQTKSPALRTQIGGLLENALLLNLESPDGLELTISAWKETPTSSQEVDFVVREANRIVPIECKASLSVSARSFNSLKSYMELSGVACGILVSGAPFQVIKSKNVTLINVPFYLAVKPILSRLLEKLTFN